jgi:hypothetical protein
VEAALSALAAQRGLMSALRDFGRHPDGLCCCPTCARRFGQTGPHHPRGPCCCGACEPPADACPLWRPLTHAALVVRLGEARTARLNASWASRAWHYATGADPGTYAYHERFTAPNVAAAREHARQLYPGEPRLYRAVLDRYGRVERYDPV